MFIARKGVKILVVNLNLLNADCTKLIEKNRQRLKKQSQPYYRRGRQKNRPYR